LSKPKKKQAAKPVAPKVVEKDLFDKIEDWLAVNGKWVLLPSWLFFMVFYVAMSSDELCGLLGGDNAHYIMLAKSLAIGRGYRDLYLPGEPIHTQYPFVLPLLMSPFAVLKHQTFWSHVLINFIASFIPLLAAAWARLTGRSRFESLLLFFIVATIPNLFTYIPNILTELPFMLFLYLELFLFAYAKLKGLDGFRLFIMVVLALLSFYTRTAAIVLGAAVCTALLLDRQFRKIRFYKLPAWFWAGALFAIGVLPWFIFTKKYAGDIGYSYWNQMISVNPYQPSLGHIGLADMVARIKYNTAFHFIQWGDFLGAENFSPGAGRVSAFISLLIATIGFGYCCYRKRWLEVSFYLFFLAIILTWSFREERFLYPLLPMTAYFFIIGLNLIGRFYSKKFGDFLYVIPVAMLLVQLAIVGMFVRMYFKTDLEPVEPVFISNYGKFSGPLFDFSKYSPFWGGGEQLRQVITDRQILMQVAKEKLPEDAVILSGKPRLTWYYSGRKSVRVLSEGTDQEQWANIRKNNVDYLLIEPMYNQSFQFALNSKERLALVYGSQRTGTLLVKVVSYPELPQ
jgi:hypothetical protein